MTKMTKTEICWRLVTMPDPEIAAVRVRLEVPASEQMRALGARLADALLPGDLVVLDGPLGAGKTTLVQGIGAGLGVRGPITSPTFVIARLHPSLVGGPDLVHADAYRLGSRLEVDDLDLDADVDHCVTVVEWGEGLVEGLAAGHLLIAIGWAPQDSGDAGLANPGSADLEAGDQPDEPRVVTLTGYGDRWEAAAGQLRQAIASRVSGPPSGDRTAGVC
jgi:tRNA threonylcarbamoyladenosine biosynthesis protein TsaE